jgi:threonine/homoserine/homoserine lactone efflux protein
METLLPLVSFTFVASITPGPNNLMLAASGVGFGLRRTIPHMLGVCVGFAMLVLVCALGVGAIVMQNPLAATALKVVGSGYLIYLAWLLRGHFDATANGPGTGARPMTFAAAAAFQFANPKAWLMAVTGAGAFLPGFGTDWAAIALFCLVITLVNAPCISSWAVLGSAIRARLHEPVWQRRFSTLMVVLTLYAAAAIWL